VNWLRLQQGIMREGEGGEGGSGGGGAAPAGGATLLAGGAAAPDPAPATPAAAAPAPAASSGWLKDDSGAFSEGWVDRLDGDLKNHGSLKTIGTVADLAKAFVETKKLVGSKLEMPGEGATPEQWSHWRKVTGAPEAPEGYLGDAKTLRPETVPESMWDAATEKGFLEIAHKHGLPPQAVKEIVEFHAKSIGGAIEKTSEEHAAHLQGEQSKLKSEWGGEFDSNLSLAARAAKTAGLDPTTNPIFADAEVVKAFAKLGRMFSETSLVPGDASGAAGGGIEGRIKEIQDPQSSAMVAREYRGEFGPERQQQAAGALRALIKAKAERGGK
jgi:hypothetical protein